MNFPGRRSPIALLLCYGVASTFAGGYPAYVWAQAAQPLHVDPALLGLPSTPPAEAQAPAPASSGVLVPAPAVVPVVPVPVEVRPVEAPVVETKPAEAEAVVKKPAAKSNKASPQAIPSQAAVPKSAPAEATPSPAPSPAEAAAPIAVAPARTEREEDQPQARSAPVPQSATPPEKPLDKPQPAATPVQAAPKKPAVQEAVQPAAGPSPAIVHSAPPSPVSPMAPLRVDPALLGGPPAAPAPTTAVQATRGVAPAQSQSAAQSAGAEVSAPGVPQSSAAPAAPPPVKTAQVGTPTRLGQKTTDSGKSWYNRVSDPVVNAYNNGDWEVYLPFHTYHVRSTYSQDQIDSYQENPPGIGVGRGSYDEKGNWDGLLAMGFQDSHFKPMYTAGYSWKSIWRPSENTRFGLGYFAGLVSRADIASYIPFPIALPVASLAYKNLSLEAAYVPPFSDKGNVFLIWAKWEFGKKGEAIGTPARPAPEPSVETANTSFGAATPLAFQKVPYGPPLDTTETQRLAGTPQTVPPLVPATGPRDEEEVPDNLPPLALQASKRMEPLPRESNEARPVFLSSYRMGGDVDRELVAEGAAELRKVGTVVNAERLTYWPIDDEMEAEGNVRLEQGEDVVTGPKMRLKLEDQVGFFEMPSYTLKHQPKPGDAAATTLSPVGPSVEKQGVDDWLNSGFATPRVLNIKPGQTSYDVSDAPVRTATVGRGDADRIDFEGKNHIRMTNGSYTTCAPGNDDWYATAGELKLDYDREVADGKDAKIYFKDVPILYSPWMSFSLNNERKSGFLVPSFGTNSDSGFTYTQPYYWNIAPNMDATISPRMMTRRGVEIENEFRYLNTSLGGLYNGKVAVDVLPRDNIRDGDTRWGVSVQHNQTTANGFSGLINYNKVSDDNFFTDLSSGIASTSTTQLLQQALVSYSGGGWWNATANFQEYQTLQPDPLNPVLEAYRMLPQITVNARKPDFYMTDSSFLGQFTAFSKPKQVINGVTQASPDGDRTVLYPQVALPYVTPGWYVTPKLGLNVRNYSLSGQATGVPDSINVTLPVASVDSGMTFERTSNWYGRDYTQTLEPRLYYLNIPYKNQDNIPIFDTALADFNFAQIFSENQFSSWDRISNANQLTAGLTSRLLEPSTGNEIIRAMIGQRFYFTQNKVELTPTSTTTTTNQKWERSDFLAAFNGQVLPKVFVDTALQYNLADREVKRYSLGARYQPEPGKVINAAYRYNSDSSAPIDQVDFSGQWPLSGRWYAVGRINYSFKDDGASLSTSSQGGRMIQSIAGLEYSAGCWVLRGVVQRLALTQDTATTSFFIQLELNDFSRIGTNPLNLLKRNIQGYSVINQPAADTVFGE